MSLRKGAMITMLLSFIAATTVVAGNDSMKKPTETATGKSEKATFAVVLLGPLVPNVLTSPAQGQQSCCIS